MRKRIRHFMQLTSITAAMVAGLFVVQCGQSKQTAADDAPHLATVYAASEKKVLASPLAGQWYEADPEKLKAEIDGYLAKAEAPALDPVQALILPHAGYKYSGQIAACGIKTIAGKKFSRVVVMGPSHHFPLENFASVPAGYTHYSTPLGELPIDTQFIAALKQHPQFKTVHGALEQEHSVQIEVPLLHRALGEFQLVPIVVGQLDKDAAQSMAQVLRGLVDAETLVVASSDFTHYGADYDYVPFKDNVLDNLKKLDMGAWDYIEKKNYNGFIDYVDQTRDTICGRAPIAVLLAMLPGASQPHLVKYDTSGNLTNDTTRSVSYLSIAFTGKWEKAAPPAPAATAATQTLSDEDKAQLLALARARLETYVKTQREADPDELGIKITPGMSQVMGAFVTLKEKGELRGCIGEIFPRRPLYKAVMDHAINSGVKDHRFSPVSPKELPLLEYEISALTEPRPIPAYTDIVLGKHGMVIEKDGRTAVFLPQVAPEQGWTLDETLTQLSRKAGLPADAWKSGASWTVFEAIVFNEKK
jgi:hypothetical protein